MSRKKIRVGDLVKQKLLLISDGHRMRNEELGDVGTPFVRGGDIGIHGEVSTSVRDHIRHEFIDRIRTKLSCAGDTVFITKGTVGRAGYIKANQPQVVFSPQVALWRTLDKDKISARFLYYLVKSREFQHQLDAVKSHGAMAADYVSISQQYDFIFDFPDAAEQYAIADILGALDDKIELNRRMNETLEAMARAIFKDWFVDFGPTRAKMEGRAPYLAPDIWSLFPDRLDEEGKPEGWEFTSLGSLADRIAIGPFGSDITTDNFVSSGVPVIRGTNLKNGFNEETFVFLDPAKADSLSNANAYPGDIILTHRGTLGQVGIIPENCIYSRYVISQSQMLLRVDMSKSINRFVFEFLRSKVGEAQLLSATSQTGVPAIARPTTTLKALRVIDPGAVVQRAFDALATPLAERMAAADVESRTLAATRDLLLPKLMSGEIRIRDAEKLVGDVA